MRPMLRAARPSSAAARDDAKHGTTAKFEQTASMDVFRFLADELDAEGRYWYFSSLANHLRYPNAHTHYFSCVILYLFSSSNKMVKEQIARELIERLIANRPHPWGLLVTTLGRLGLVAFAKTKAGKLNALQSVKAVFHHMSRGLTRSRVLDIVATHGSASIHAGRFYSGSVAFNNRFLDMWRYEGSPDYLAVGVSEGGDLTGDITTTIPLIPVAAGKKGPEAITPLSPSRRLTSSAALVDERVVLNGAGRGREALDRLVRNAFIRNAVASTTSISPTVAMKTQAAKDDSITPAIPTCEGGSPPVEDGRAQRHPPAPPTHEPLRSVEDEPAAEVAGDMRPTAPPLFTPDKPAVLRPYVSGGLQLHPHDERSLFESILLKGGVFKKYGQWGNPHRRFVWCAKEFDGACWRPINKKHSLTKEDGRTDQWQGEEHQSFSSARSANDGTYDSEKGAA